MPVNWSDPQQVEAFRREVISKGADPQQAEAYIAQHAQVAPTEPQAPEEPKTLSGFAGNIVKSGARTIGDIGSAVINVLNPNMEKNTVANLGRLALGTGELLVPGEQGHEQYPKAVGNFYKSRYGSLKAAGDTLYNDPVGALLDASIVLDAGASLVGKVGEVGKVEGLVKASKTAKGVAGAIDPLRLTTKAVGKVLNPKLEATGKAVEKAGTDVRQGVSKIYEPGSVYGAEREAKINKTLSDAGITGSSQAKYEKLQPVMEDLSKQIKTSLESNPQIVTVSDMTSFFKENIDQMLRTKDITAPQAIKEFNGYISDLAKKKLSKNGEILTTDLFDLKKLVNDDYGNIAKKIDNGTALTPREKVISAARKTLDDVIADIHPDVKEMTIKQSDLYDAATSLNRSRKTNPTTRIAGTTVPAQVTQSIQDKSGEILQGVGSKISSSQIPQVGTNPYIKATTINERSNKQRQNEVQNIQGYDQQNISNNNSNEQLNSGYDHAGSISQDQQNIQSSTYPNPQTGEQTYNSFGATAPQIWEAYIKTLESGNKRKAAVLKEMYNHELDMKAIENPKLNSSAAKAFSDNQTAINLANSLDGTISEFSDKMGPIAGRAASKNPYDTDAQAFQAEMEAAAQIIGKSMEGGVLRQEDIVKYRKILPQITDTPEVARRKIQAIKKLLKDQQRNQEKFYKNAQQDVVVQSPGGGGSPGLNLGSRVNNFSTSRMQKPGLQLTPKYLYK